MVFDPQSLKNFPKEPGVYLMKGARGKILYVGKAKNLQSRLKQYFVKGGDGRPKIPYLISQVEGIDTIVVDSEKEALILENNLIKRHQPKYNAFLKDDKTYFSLMINHKHLWPMVKVARFKGKPPPDALYFGPYTKGYAAKQTLELIQTLFPLRQCSDRELVSRTRPCILYDLKRCMAPCTALCSHEEYSNMVDRVINFLKGHDRQIIKEIKAEIETASKNLEFEKAAHLYRTLQHIEATLEPQKVEKAGSIDTDVFGLFREERKIVITKMLFREGKLLATADTTFSHNAQEDQELLTSFLLQHYEEASSLPKEILLPVKLDDHALLHDLLQIKITTPERGNKLALIKMAMKNAKAMMGRSLPKDESERLLIDLQERFQLTNYPQTIECFDNSNSSGDEPVSALVCFKQGVRDSRSQRTFKVKSNDDYGALQEVMTRRYSKAKQEGHLPDLIVIDGGKGHLNLGLKALHDLDISTVDVIAVAKDESKHTKGVTREQIFIESRGDPIYLKQDSPLLFFLQRIRDEAHRVAISFHRKRRDKKALSSSLDTLPGIGPVKKKRLLSHFGSVKQILRASEEELREVSGISNRDIETLSAFRKKKEFENKKSGN